MTDPSPSADAPESGEPPADEERARTYADGFGEGIRTALKDLLQHVSQGYTASELRLLVQGRLARVGDEIELRRRSMLGPPRPRADVLFGNGSSPRPWSPTGGSVRVVAGQSYLVNETRPTRAIALMEGAIERFPKTVLLSLHPPALPGLPVERRLELSLTGASAPEEAAHPIAIGRIAGQLQSAMSGGALVYIDALDFFLAEESPDTLVKFSLWLADDVRKTGSAAIVSINAASLDLKQYARLQRAFSVQA